MLESIVLHIYKLKLLEIISEYGDVIYHMQERLQIRRKNLELQIPNNGNQSRIAGSEQRKLI